MNKRLADLPIGSKHPPGPPMTLGNTRDLGVLGLLLAAEFPR